MNKKPLDDLTIIKGLGSVWQRRLRDYVGVRTYQDLADLLCEDILSQLKASKEFKAEKKPLPTMSDCESWISQAKELAAEAEDSSDAEAKNNDTGEQTVTTDGTEKWRPYATFVVEFLTRTREGENEERHTRVHRIEDGGADDDWDGIDILALSRWIAEQIGEPPWPELEQQLEDERTRMQLELDEELSKRQETAYRELEKRVEEERDKKLKTLQQALEEEKAKLRREMEAEIEREHSKARQALEQALEEEKAKLRREMEAEIEREHSEVLQAFEQEMEGQKAKARQELERKLEEEKIQAQQALQKQLEEERIRSLDELEQELDRGRAQALHSLEQELDEMKTRAMQEETEEERIQTQEEEILQTPKKPKEEVRSPAVELKEVPNLEEPPPEAPAFSEPQVKPSITQIRAFQPLDAKEPIGRGKAGQPFSGFVSSIEPFKFDVDFELAEPAGSELEQFGKNYHVEFYIRDISTGEKKHLGNTQADTFVEGESSYAAQLAGVTLTPGVYNLLVFLLVQNGRPSADFWEIPFLQVT